MNKALYALLVAIMMGLGPAANAGAGASTGAHEEGDNGAGTSTGLTAESGPSAPCGISTSSGICAEADGDVSTMAALLRHFGF